MQNPADIVQTAEENISLRKLIVTEALSEWEVQKNGTEIR